KGQYGNNPPENQISAVHGSNLGRIDLIKPFAGSSKCAIASPSGNRLRSPQLGHHLREFSARAGNYSQPFRRSSGRSAEPAGLDDDKSRSHYPGWLDAVVATHRQRPLCAGRSGRKGGGAAYQFAGFQLADGAEFSYLGVGSAGALVVRSKAPL